MIGGFGYLWPISNPLLQTKAEGRAICGVDDDITWSSATAAWSLISTFLPSLFPWKSIDSMDEKQQLYESLPVANAASEQRVQAKKTARWGIIKRVCRAPYENINSRD